MCTSSRQRVSNLEDVPVSAVIFVVVLPLAGVGESRELWRDVICSGCVEWWAVRHLRGVVEASEWLAVGHGEDENHEDNGGHCGDQHRFTDFQPPPPIKPTTTHASPVTQLAGPGQGKKLLLIFCTVETVER